MRMIGPVQSHIVICLLGRCCGKHIDSAIVMTHIDYYVLIFFVISCDLSTSNKD